MAEARQTEETHGTGHVDEKGNVEKTQQASGTDAGESYDASQPNDAGVDSEQDAGTWAGAGTACVDNAQCSGNGLFGFCLRGYCSFICIKTMGDSEEQCIFGGGHCVQDTGPDAGAWAGYPVCQKLR
jgi:hypothetical protein